VCYARGHNKRSCPELTERHQSRFANYKAQHDKEIAAGVPVDEQRYRGVVEREAATIAKRTGRNPLTGATLKKRGPTRRCSYCKYKHGSHGEAGLGHTRRTCPTFKEDYAAAIVSNADYRAGILETFRQSGVGVGALISVRMSGYWPDENGEEKWDRRICAAMVRRIDWDRINYTDFYADPVLTQRMDSLGSRDGYNAIGVPYRYIKDAHDRMIAIRFSPREGWGTSGSRIGNWTANPDGDEETTHSATMLSGVPRVTVNPPSDWASGESDVLKEHFKQLKE
jgi:hypothetical protein|tara:strand:- start:17060 stop:17905 length:846 start_codon:yes stop_codon:yes gene_type:complete